MRNITYLSERVCYKIGVTNGYDRSYSTGKWIYLKIRELTLL